MSCKLEACEECTLMCHVMHRRNGDASSIATSFFKVLFGFNYNDFLLMPPTFARRIQHSNGQEVQLVDSSGEQWTVKVSKVEDSLAFVEGWNAFANDHRLKVGEILVFHHINLSNPAHFFVQIYGIGGCPVFRFNDNENSNKQSRTEGDFGDKAGPSCVNDKEVGSDGPVYSGSKRSRTEGDFGDKAGPSCVNDKEVGSDGPVYFDSGSKRSRTDKAGPSCVNDKEVGSDGPVYFDSGSKSRTEGDFGDKVGPSCVNDKEVGSDGPVYFDSGSKTLQDVLKTRQFEEPLFMIERDDGCIQEEDRSSLFDLSKYELPVGDKKSSHLDFLTNKDVVNNDSVNLSGNILKTLNEKPEENLKKTVVRTEEEAVCPKAENPSITVPIEIERSSREDKRILKSPSEAQVFNNDSVKCLKMPKNAREQNTKEKSTAHAVESERSSHQDKSDVKAQVFNNSVKLSGNVLDTFCAKTTETGIKFLQMSKYARRQNDKEKSTVNRAETMKVTKTEPAEMSDMHVCKGMFHGSGKEGIKEGGSTFNLPIKGEIFGVVKAEPVDFDDALPSDDLNASCPVVIKSENHLELPTEFPSIVRAKSGVDRRVVLIRGPDTRLWAVMYIQKFGIKSLNSGWKEFCKANGVQPGDECLFRREHSNQACVFRFSVVNRQVNGKKAWN